MPTSAPDAPDAPDDRQLLTVLALNAAAQARAIAAADPSWSSEVLAVGGGWLVLCGKGLYVNRAIGVGVEQPLGAAELDLIVHRCEAHGLPPSIEATQHTHPATVALLDARGFMPRPERTVIVHVSPTTARLLAPADVMVQPVRTLAELQHWQQLTALGWGHAQAAARRASDVFSAAAHGLDGEGMVIAYDRQDGRPLGCASTTLREGLATLGAMSTLPAERRRGVQAALVHHRLLSARQRGCEWALSTALAGGASARNLMRLGFVPRFELRCYERDGRDERHERHERHERGERGER